MTDYTGMAQRMGHTEFHGLVERSKEADLAFDRYDQNQRHYGSLGIQYDPDLERLRIAAMQNKLDLQTGAESFNRHAEDLEKIRKLLTTELTAGRSAFEHCEKEVKPVPRLASAEPKAILSNIEARLQRQATIESQTQTRAQTVARLSAVFASIAAAEALLITQRAKDGLPHPKRVLDWRALPEDGCMRESGAVMVPHTTDQVDCYLENIEAQRHPSERKGMTPGEANIYQMQRTLDECLTRQAEAAERERLLRDEPDFIAGQGLAGETVNAVVRARRDAGKAATT